MNRPDRHPTGRTCEPPLPVDGAAGRLRRWAPHRPALALLLGAAVALPAAAAPTFTLSQYPLFLTTPVNPNVLVMLDNSQSMDATMTGKMIAGTDANTRSSIARNVLRSIIDTYRHNFNWGLGSFELSGDPSLYMVYGVYLGNASTMVYTNTCDNVIDGVGVSDVIGVHAVVVNGVKQDVTGKLPCIANPEPATNGKQFLTFSRSGDDADINGAAYYAIDYGPQIYAIGASGSSYRRVKNRASGESWSDADLNSVSSPFNRNCIGGCNPVIALPVDAGWAPDATEFPRQILIRRTQGFNGAISGAGLIAQRVQNSQTTTSAQVSAEAAHFSRLNALLAPEVLDTTSVPLKNAAQGTPLAGALATSHDYFSGSYVWRTTTDASLAQGSVTPSPIDTSLQCQSNYVILATDGNATARTNGSRYAAADVTNTLSSNGSWSFGAAANDVFTQIDALRATRYNGTAYDVKSYVVGMGDLVINPGSVAALNEMARRGGTGSAYTATTSTAMTQAFQAIVSRIISNDNTAAAVAVSSSSYQSGSALYQARFNSTSWSGTLLALGIDSNGVLATTPTWNAATRITAQNWDTGRAIVTYKPSAALGSRGVAFRWPANPSVPTNSEIDAAQAAALNAGPTSGTPDGAGALRVSYLRGDPSHEAGNTSCTDATCTTRFHDRVTSSTDATRNVLGDIVNSAPAYVGAPSAGFANDIAPSSYTAFASTHASRPPHLYVGANDGMLHAINAATGNETFAYVPNLVFPSLSWQTKNPYDHRYTVDGSPSVGDVFYDGAWHTLLVAGLRSGGKGLYALDVTDPAAVTESNAASVVRWELSDDDLGYVFAKPALVKTRNGRWSVIIGNGYNATVGNAAASPRAKLFVIDAETGAVTAKIDTGAGTAASPNGLSGASPVDLDGDDVVDVVYAGDLDGNLWKFDLTSATPASWTVATGGAALFAAGSAKPITTAPDVARHPRGGVTVVFATGRFLSTSDLVGTTTTQTAYGLWDRQDGTVISASSLQQQVILAGTTTAAGDTYRFSSHRVGAPSDAPVSEDLPTVIPNDYYTNRRGWYLDLPDGGERVVVDPVVRGGRAIFTSMVPSSSSCSADGTGWVTEVDVNTGNRLDAATFDTNNNAILTTSDFLNAPGTSATINTTSWKIGALPGGAGFMTFKQANSTDTTEIKYVPTAQGSVVQKREGPGTLTQRRVMWRVVQ